MSIRVGSRGAELCAGPPGALAYSFDIVDWLGQSRHCFRVNHMPWVYPGPWNSAIRTKSQLERQGLLSKTL